MPMKVPGPSPTIVCKKQSTTLPEHFRKQMRGEILGTRADKDALLTTLHEVKQLRRVRVSNVEVLQKVLSTLGDLRIEGANGH